MYADWPPGRDARPTFIAGPDADGRMHRTISTDDAPAAVGAYSQATATDDLVFTAGQIPLTPDGDLLDEADVDVQTQQALENVAAVIEAAGGTMADVVSVTVYLDDIDDFDAMNAVYETFFDDEPPARSAVGVDALPKGVAVEIEAIANTA
jgi:2-iminobutanoate/2-iminopropanoate deaminase